VHCEDVFERENERMILTVGLILTFSSLSGGDDDAHGNQTVMEMLFDEGNAEWEITRYGKL
jgi:hypothetical protein